MKIFIDPGHGGKDPGAVGHGIHEADIVLDIAKRVNSKLCNYENIQVKLSRYTDVFLELSQRTNLVNSWGADVLISIHINAGQSSANGIETFIYTNASNESLVVASAIQGHLIRECNRNNRGVKKGDLHLVRESKMPACLVECGFISNKEEAALMKTDKYLDQCAEAIVKGLVDTYKLKSKNKVTVASTEVKKEEVRIMKASTGAGHDAISRTLLRLAEVKVHGENAISPIWRDKFLKDELKESEAIELLYVAIDRGLLDKRDGRDG